MVSTCNMEFRFLEDNQIKLWLNHDWSQIKTDVVRNPNVQAINSYITLKIPFWGPVCISTWFVISTKMQAWGSITFSTPYTSPSMICNMLMHVPTLALFFNVKTNHERLLHPQDSSSFNLYNILGVLFNGIFPLILFSVYIFSSLLNWYTRIVYNDVLNNTIIIIH